MFQSQPQEAEKGYNTEDKLQKAKEVVFNCIDEILQKIANILRPKVTNEDPYKLSRLDSQLRGIKRELLKLPWADNIHTGRRRTTFGATGIIDTMDDIEEMLKKLRPIVTETTDVNALQLIPSIMRNIRLGVQ